MNLGFKMLEKIKKYLKVDHEIEDELIQSFIELAKAYIEEKTGVQYAENDAIYEDLIRLMVAYRYYNRNAIGEKTLVEYPYSINEMLKTLSFRGKNG